jgi:acetyl-CoA acetyltransferase
MTFGEGCAIVGIGETALGSQPGRTALDLQAEAVRTALADAGLGPGDVDGLFNLGPYSRPAQMFAMTLAEYLGLSPSVQASIDAGGTMSPVMMVANAIWAIRSGLCAVAVCTFGEAAATGRVKAGRGWTSTADTVEFEEPYGIVGAVVPYALLASRHMAEFGTTEGTLFEVAASARRHAALTPNAVRRTPFTIDEYRASRMIATPLRLFDCSTMVDGGGALVITSADRARDLRHDPVSVLGVAAQMTHRNAGEFPGFDELGIGAVGRRALGMAGVEIGDVDVAEIHDAFTISTVVYLEELGFCARGETGAHAAGGHLDHGARCPVNTHGGLLSQGHVAGMLHFTEAVKQLRGKEGERQVPGAEVAMVAGGGGILGVNAVMLLGRSG